MSKKMLIPEIMIRLNGPTSSTKQIEVATRFGGDTGCIIQLDNNSYQQNHLLRCIDLGWTANYSEEDEYLLCGGERSKKGRSGLWMGSIWLLYQKGQRAYSSHCNYK